MRQFYICAMAAPDMFCPDIATVSGGHCSQEMERWSGGTWRIKGLRPSDAEDPGSGKHTYLSYMAAVYGVQPGVMDK